MRAAVSRGALNRRDTRWSQFNRAACGDIFPSLLNRQILCQVALEIHPVADGNGERLCSADFQVGRIAGFQTRSRSETSGPRPLWGVADRENSA